MNKLMGNPWAHSATGYIYCAVRRDGKKKIMPYHRYLMEWHLGRRLQPSEHVHHKNHDRADNHIGNLEVVHPAVHQNYHHTPERMIGAQVAIERKWGVRVSAFEERERARALVARGVPIKEVATQLGRPYVRVWKWVRGYVN